MVPTNPSPSASLVGKKWKGYFIEIKQFLVSFRLAVREVNLLVKSQELYC